ncbi:GNAT family N-acetyltransferase [Actinoplanes aureus]|uniref:GNAT family N-acetyltransferase n=1 Tax=Actinoplanes aureus TaxID=2792083 RepID=A0A931CBG2_9ACTN|nr:GNAT family N-acyltransferase [Actinoplanes aureus]MBG0561820.1 GNAT family N-acetyltransferase [Actinoplanes aureus]
MAVLMTAAAPTGTSGYTLLLADDAGHVEAAQRLRHDVFAGELGANLPGAANGLDADDFDDYCDHLIVRDDATGAVVGTYRMLPPRAAELAGRRYADSEFDLSALRPLRDHLVEIGRSCVHPDHRSGAVVNLMWAGIARYLHLNNLRWLGGCASVPLADGGHVAAGVRARLNAKHLSPPALRVRPRRPWLPADDVVADPRVAVPPLLRGYLRLGSWVCGEPAYDPDFDCADFYVLFSMDRLDPRYRRHFLGATR